MLASAVVASVCVKLGFLLAHQLEPLWNLKGDTESMQSTLQTIQAVLSDAERRSLRKEAGSERLWLKRLKKAAYEIDDLLSDFVDCIPPPKMARRRDNVRRKAKLFLSSSNPLRLRITFAHKMKDLKKQLDKIASDRRDFNFKVDTGLDKLFEVQEMKNRETFSEIENKIIGRDKEKERIVNFLLQKDIGDDISTISIVGLGGLGKTTLARLIFNEKSIEKEFNIRAWVYVSMDFDLLNIGKTILSQIDSSRDQNHDNLQSVSTRLKSALADKCFLIILDDTWEEEGYKLERLKEMLKGGKHGSKLVITTRSQRVAQLMASKNTMVHYLEGLSDEDCWSIFSQRAFISGDEVDSSLEEIGREIIKKCKGVPLAAIALGYILFSKRNIAVWSAVRDSEFWELDDDGLLPSLKLSYYQLPPALKLCFTYCAIIPKGFDINKDKLIQQWVALEFIQNTNRNLTPEETGDEYVSNLLGMSFLQYSPNYDGNQNLLRMHDLVHDLTKSIIGDEMIVLDTRKEISEDRNCVTAHGFYALVANNENEKASLDLKVLPDKIRALHFTCTSMLFPNKVFSQKRSLRVLNFGRCHMENLPDSIYHLKQLRYLEASWLKAKSLPESFGNLVNMEALDLSKSSLEELPTSIKKLRKLKNLNLHGCSLLRVLPKSFSKLNFLTHLDLSDCCSLQSLPKSFGMLSRLCFLQLSGCSELPNLPQSFGNLESLEHLNLSLCNKLDSLPECFGNLKNLKVLNLSSCIALHDIPESFGSLLNLEKIDLSYCCDLEKFPELILNSHKLQMLDLRGSNLIKFAYNAENFVNTQEGFVLLCDEMFECKEIRKGGKHFNTITRLEHLNQIRGKLHITHVETVYSPEEAEKAKLCNKSKLGSLTLQWSSSSSKSSEYARKDELMLEKLQPNQNLQLLTLDGYRGTRLRGWIMGLENSLPNLTQLTLCNLSHCEQLPSFEHLANLEILEIQNIPKTRRIHTDMQLSRGSFRKLKMISIRDMPSLEEWSIAGSTNDTKLEKLIVYKCPCVVFKPCLPSTETLIIIESSMALSWAGVESLSFKPTISKLNIESCNITSDEWEGLRGHVNIKDLNIKTCNELYFLPKDILGLTSLESLTIDNCNSLSVLPEWLGELVSLRSLSIISCLNLKSLPSSILCITALENLHIIGCSPASVERYPGVDKNKISHARNVYTPYVILAFCGSSEETYVKMAYRGVLGVGAFGPTYKALLWDGQVVAVKSLMKLNMNAFAIYFWDQIRALGAMNHAHLVRLHACIYGRVEPHLVYDFMPMGSLFFWLYGTGDKRHLPGEIRYRILHDVAHGLNYIHSISPRCAHGNIIASNVLVFGNNNYPEGAKITNYGLANLIGGPATSGYIAPELIDFSQATQKSDVYSFGVLLLEVLTGKKPERAGKASNLLGWIQNNFHDHFYTDHSRDNPMAAQEMNQMLHLVMECVSSEPESRPTMDSVARRIEDICNLLKIIQPRSENIASSIDSYGYGECAFRWEPDKEFCQSPGYFDD